MDITTMIRKIAAHDPHHPQGVDPGFSRWTLHEDA
jgi:hypothetical protein